MQFDITREANRDQPVQVDVVVAYDPELVEELDKLTAAEWFSQRSQRIRNNPGQSSFSFFHFELPPGPRVVDQDKDLPGRPAQGLLFADYQSRGKHSARFQPENVQRVQLGRDAFRVRAGGLAEPEARSVRPYFGWSAIGLGVVGMGLGTYFSIQSSNNITEIESLAPRDSEARYNQLAADTRTNRRNMGISYGIGGAFILIGALILLWPSSDESPFKEVPTGEDDIDVQFLGFRF